MTCTNGLRDLRHGSEWNCCVGRGFVMTSCFLVENVSFCLCFIGLFQKTVTFFFFKKGSAALTSSCKSLCHISWLQQSNLPSFSASIYSTKECFLQGKSLPLLIGPDTVLDKFNIENGPAVVERRASREDSEAYLSCNQKMHATCVQDIPLLAGKRGHILWLASDTSITYKVNQICPL